MVWCRVGDKLGPMLMMSYCSPMTHEFTLFDSITQSTYLTYGWYYIKSCPCKTFAKASVIFWKRHFTCYSIKISLFVLRHSSGIGLPLRVTWYVDCCPAQHHTWPVDITEYEIWAAECSELVSVNCRQPLSIYKYRAVWYIFFALTCRWVIRRHLQLK